MFLFKKVMGAMLSPLPLCLLAGFAGLILLWFTARQHTGKILVTAGIGMIFIFSCESAATLMLRPLEARYSAPEPLPDVHYIVVLGGGRVVDTRFPTISQLGSASRTRFLEGVRIYQALEGAELIFTGKDIAGPMGQLALDIGIPDADIHVFPDPKDTKDEARYVKELVGSDSFLLVTSASHMYRAVMLFEKQGTRPIPFPTGHLCKDASGVVPGDFFPDAMVLHKAERAVYEYLGILWAWLRGQI
jgi:uncharacterized SAM-binding protein YcdF (DUF218 family)